MLLKLQDTIRAWATSSGAALALGILWAGSNLASGALTPEQQDFANQLNAGRFLTIRATGKNYTTPANYEGVYSGTYDTTASANSPWLLTGLLKAGFVILTGVDGGLIGDTVNEKWGDRGCAIGLAAGTVVVAAANVAIPLSPTYVHDAELFGAIEVAGQGDILPTVTANAELFIDATVALPGLGPTISISFIDLSAVFGQVVDQFGVPIPGSSLSAFLFEDSSDNSRLFGVLATNDINQSGRPLAFTDRYKIEMENVYPGVADGTSVTVKSTLLVANAQLDCTYSAVTWTGAASPTWDINTTHNWSKSGAPAVFNNSDPVLFDDFSANWAVALAVPVQPGSVTVNSNLDYTFSGASIGGTGCAITKLGMGMLTLLNANTYGGGTSIYAGTVQLGNGGTSGSLTGNILNDGALVFNRSSTVTFPGIISGSGVVTKAGPGNSTLVLTGSSTHTGGTIISAGTLRLGSGGTTGWIAGNINNFGSLVFNRSNAVTFPGIIGGLGTVTKAGAGTLTLTGPNTYTGTTVVSTGTLLVDGSIGGGGTVSVNANCTLGGTGTIGGQVMIPLNGFLRPGHGGIGTLTTGSLTLAGTYACELDGTSGDRIAAADLNLNGATLAIATLSPPGAPSYEIATYTGTRTGTFATVTGLPSGYVIDYSSVGQVRLVMAGPSSVIYAGLVHTSRGSATMEVLANQLLVSNLGSSGQDGVTIALAANSLAWGAQWAALDTGGVLPVGAALRAQVTGTGGPVINGTLGTMQVTKAGNANYVMGADLSPLGVNSVTVLVYNGADLMAQATFATPGGIFTNLGVSTLAPTSGALTWPPSRPWPRPWPPWPHPWPPWPEPWPPFPWPEPGPLVMTWHGPTATFTLSTGDSVVGDTFVVIPEVTYGAITTSAIQVLAAQIPSLTITRETVSLEYAGLAHTSLGDATLNVTNNQLVVANLGGSSGEDGVEMALSSDLTAWEAHWQDLDPSGMLPVGAYLKQQVIGTGGTVTDGVLGIVQVTKAGSGIFLISADFSPLGSNTRTVQVYRGHTLVAEVTGQSGALCATSVSISGSASVGWWPLYVDVDFSVSVDISIDGVMYQGDRVVMIPEGAAAPTLPLTVQLTASQIPSITITSEDKTLEYAGLAHTSMGNAVLDGIDNKLLVANLGTNGNDGVEIALPAKLSAWEAHWQDLDPGGMLPVGAYLRQQVIGTGGTVTDGVLGTVQVTKAGSGNYLISADFSPLGSSTRTVQVYRGSTLVAQVTGQSGALCATSVSISGSASVGWWPLYVDVDFSVSVDISIDGVMYQGDRVVMIPEGAAAPTLPLTVQLTASQIPSITITSEDKTLEYAGLAHTSLGNATLDVIDNKLTVSNLGSSGQDGVGIALPAELSAWEAHWQDLDPGGMLPVGAYLKQQVIGTGGTVTNGVLGTVQVTKENVGNYTISADFSPLGSNTRTVQVYRGSTLVAEVTGQSGALCATSVSISGSASVGWWPLYLDVDFNVSVNISIGGTTYLGDRVVMIPEGAAAPTLPLTVQLTASQIPSITITSEDAAGGYATWTRLQGLTPANNGPAQDPEADGIINLMEFYLNGNPLALDRSILPTATLDADYLTLRFKRLDAAELEMTQQAVQFGASLTSWSASVIGPVSSPPDGNGVIVTVSENGADPDDITVQIPRSKAIAGQLFGRLQIGK